MCGISGFIGTVSDFNIDDDIVGNLTRHRGPDNLGSYVDDNAILIHNRLSVIDLSEMANQPMESSDRRFVIVFNGEIYNYRSLRKQLAQEYNVKFFSESDTEVILYGFINWGIDSLLDKLDGMFALSIWDRERKLLICARDHIGIKPLYYSLDQNGFFFASELKVLENTCSDLKVDTSSIIEYLLYNYIPAPKTIYKNLHKLKPGHYIKYSFDDREYSEHTWWSVPKSEYIDMSYSEAVKLVKSEVSKSIRDQLVADVPVGAFLSGGVDSSIIAAEIASCHSNVNVYSVGYPESTGFDETKYAEQVAKQFGLKHHVIRPNFSEGSILSTVDGILDQMDEPYGNPTVAMTQLICKRARDEVVVGLSGDGGDEVFGGYPRYRALSLATKYQRVNSLISAFAKPILNRLPETPKGNHFIRRSKQYLSSVDKPIHKQFQDWSSCMNYETLSLVLNKEMSTAKHNSRTSYLSGWFESNSGTAVDNACYSDINTFLPYNLLDGADRMSMKQSFELRVPFVSKRLIELSMGLRSEWKVEGNVTKRILKDAYSKILPHNILHRKKRGFNPPVWNWLHDNSEFVTSYLGRGSRVSKIFYDGYISEQVSDLYTMKKDNSSHIWSLIVLERWMERKNINVENHLYGNS